MVSKTFALCAAALLQSNTALAAPTVGGQVELPIMARADTTVPAPVDIDPVRTVEEMTEEELAGFIAAIEAEVGEPTPTNSTTQPATRSITSRAQGSSGALLTYIAGQVQPGSGDASCPDFALNGPFSSIHAFMGTSNFRGIIATSLTGNTTELQAGETIIDADAFTFDPNERITKFSVGTTYENGGPAAISFETDAGKSYLAQSQTVQDNKSPPTWEDLNVGSGVLARIYGTSCNDLGIFGSVGFDFIDVIDSVGISNIDYEGFTNNIMPSGAGTEMSVGSQILDNRNSSEKQTITLTTTDAVTKQSTVTTDLQISSGGKVAIEAGVGIPFVSEGKVTTEVNWNIASSEGQQDMENAVTTRAGTFNLVCPAGKFCTARAFFTKYKLDVTINATMTATVKSGETYSWIQSGEYKGADSLAMQFNVTEVSTPPS